MSYHQVKNIKILLIYFLLLVFITYAAVSLISIIVLIYFAAPKYGATYPIVYITICSLVGSFLVLSIQGKSTKQTFIEFLVLGFGSSIIYSIAHWEDDNQFLLWQMYVLIAFILLAVVMQINYLNKALNLFSTAIITPG